jgi:WS/DGAT/MGAT family acyltransferase
MEHPTNPMTITGVFTFAERFDRDAARGLAERMLRFERFRQRVVARGPLARPRWERDPSFDLANHVVHVALPEGAAGDDAALQALVGALMSTPLAYDRPLWQFHHVESFGGGSALVVRVHHCIADGMSLVQVLLGIADAPPALPALGRRARPRARGDAPGPLVSARRLWAAARAGGGLAGAVARVLDLRADPPTPFRGALGRTKRAAWSAPIALDEVRRVGKAHGATVNDVLLSTVAGAMRRYVHGRGAAMAEGVTLRAVVPVNLRPPEDVALGNRFGMVFLPLPVGHDDPVERLRAVKREMDRIKRSPEAVVIFGLLRAFGATTTRLLKLAVNVLGRKATTVMTNVPGPTEPVCFFGRPVDTLMFWVPQSGRLGLGVSILSYCGDVRVGIAADAGLVPDPHTLVAAFHDAFDDLRAALDALDAHAAPAAPAAHVAHGAHAPSS